MFLVGLFLLAWGHSIGGYHLLRDDFIVMGMRQDSFPQTLRNNWSLNGIWRIVGYTLQAHGTAAPGLFHGSVILLGAATGVLAYLFLRELLRNRRLALLGAGTWVLLPPNHEMFLFIDRTHYLMAVFCWLLAGTCHLRVRDCSSRGPGRGAWAAASFASSFGACVTLESAMPLVLVLPLLSMPEIIRSFRNRPFLPVRLLQLAAPSLAVALFLSLYFSFRPETAFQEVVPLQPKVVSSYHFFALDAVAVGFEPLVKPRLWWLAGFRLLGPGLIVPLLGAGLLAVAWRRLGTVCRGPEEQPADRTRFLWALAYAIVASFLLGALFAMAGLRSGARIYLAAYLVYLLGGLLVLRLSWKSVPVWRPWMGVLAGVGAILLLAMDWFVVGHWKFASLRTYSLAEYLLQTPPPGPVRPVYLLDFRRELPRQSFRWSPVDEAWGVIHLVDWMARERGLAGHPRLEPTSDFSWAPVEGETIVRNGPGHFDWTVAPE